VSKRKLLLADDSITIQKVVNLTFADEGIEVISVGDGDSAMEKINESAPDLVLADVNMPGLSGYQICERIKQGAQTQAIPVILLVGSFEPFDEAEAYRVGADDYLTKPFQSIRQLVSKVSELLEAKGNETEISPENEFAGGDETLETAENTETARSAEATISENVVSHEITETYQDAAAREVSEETELREPEKSVPDLHFADTREFPAEEEVPDRLGDAGMDDEMIQANHIEDLSGEQEQKFMSAAQTAISDENAAGRADYVDFDSTGNFEPVEDFEATQPFDIENLQRASYQETEETEEAAIYDFPDETAAPVGEFAENRETQNNQAAVTSEQESAVAADKTEKRPMPPVLAFDGLDLLEVPSLTSSAPQAAQEAAKTEEAKPIEAEAPAEVQQNAQETKDQELIAGFSPELIDAIAQKVAEKISDKTIREIAWEVVPQMTDLIVKKMAEEKLKE
jgi:CheY-like chemotaxis protein